MQKMPAVSAEALKYSANPRDKRHHDVIPNTRKARVRNLME
jgi:hypothetical protein